MDRSILLALLFLMIGSVAGALVTYLIMRYLRVVYVERATAELTRQQAILTERLNNERAIAAERLSVMELAQQKFEDTFKAVSSDALRNNSQSFLELARASLDKYQETARMDLDHRQKSIDALVKPLHESLKQVDEKVGSLERARIDAYASVNEQIKSLGLTHQKLQAETQNLVKALRAPTVRGRWGEIQLKRVVEMAGMVERCDFHEQASIAGEDGWLRPDLIVRLPGGKNVVVDSKAPLQAYLESLEAADENERLSKLKEHARHVRQHLSRLSDKQYWNQLEPCPEFVVLFLPGEPFFSAALEQDPSLIEAGAEQKIVIATPTTLIALLRAVAYGWKQEQLAENALQVSKIGKELYERIRGLAGHFADMKKGLDRTVDSYNKAVGTMESRVLVSARRIAELGVGDGQEIPQLEPQERALRVIHAPDLIPPARLLDVSEFRNI